MLHGKRDTLGNDKHPLLCPRHRTTLHFRCHHSRTPQPPSIAPLDRSGNSISERNSCGVVTLQCIVRRYNKAWTALEHTTESHVTYITWPLVRVRRRNRESTNDTCTSRPPHIHTHIYIQELSVCPSVPLDTHAQMCLTCPSVLSFSITARLSLLHQATTIALDRCWHFITPHLKISLDVSRKLVQFCSQLVARAWKKVAI